MRICAMNKHAMLAAALSLFSVARDAQTPTFRTETTVVQLPVRVLDAKGSFVRDLAAADIEVLEDGVPQAISEFTLVDLSSERAAFAVDRSRIRSAVSRPTSRSSRAPVCVPAGRRAPWRRALAAREGPRQGIHPRSLDGCGCSRVSSSRAARRARTSRATRRRCCGPSIA